MKKNAATETTETATETAATPKVQRSTAITLSANGTVLQIHARRNGDGSGRSFVTTRDTATKTITRGMTEAFDSFEKAKARIETLATKAAAGGWVRKAGMRGFSAKPDAFAALPAPPKAAPAAKGKSK